MITRVETARQEMQHIGEFDYGECWPVQNLELQWQSLLPATVMIHSAVIDRSFMDLAYAVYGIPSKHVCHSLVMHESACMSGMVVYLASLAFQES